MQGNMNYELALKLKEAGFPQPINRPHRGYWYDPNGVLNVSGEYEGGGYWTYEPTLEELIEACGDNLRCLYRDEPEWVATIADPRSTDWELWEDRNCIGSTPIEAVANLYIALNSK